MKKSYDFKGYIDEKGFAVGYEYEAIIELKGEWASEETIDFIRDSFVLIR